MTALDMSFCNDHWGRLRTKIEEADLMHLVSANGDIAAMKEASFHRGDEVSRDNFDPLLYAHNAIMLNAMDLLGGPFNGCPLCTLDQVHSESCVGDEECQLPREDAFSFWLDKATEDAEEMAGLIEGAEDVPECPCHSNLCGGGPNTCGGCAQCVGPCRECFEFGCAVCEPGIEDED